MSYIEERKLQLQQIQEMAEGRLALCQQCDKYKKKFCTACGCFMPAKVRLKNVTCPLKKW